MHLYHLQMTWQEPEDGVIYFYYELNNDDAAKVQETIEWLRAHAGQEYGNTLAAWTLTPQHRGKSWRTPMVGLQAVLEELVTQSRYEEDPTYYSEHYPLFDAILATRRAIWRSRQGDMTRDEEVAFDDMVRGVEEERLREKQCGGTQLFLIKTPDNRLFVTCGADIEGVRENLDQALGPEAPLPADLANSGSIRWMGSQLQIWAVEPPPSGQMYQELLLT